MSCRRWVVAASVLVAVCAIGFLSCGTKETGTSGGGEGLSLVIPASLAAPMEGVTAEFEKQHPGVKVKTEIAGGLDAARAIAEKGQKADVFATSDYAVIETQMMPKAATWYVKFAKNYIQLAFTAKSKFADAVHRDDWYAKVLVPGVKVACADPNADPLGYRSLMAVQLAEAEYMQKGLVEKFKKNCVAKDIRTDGAEIVKMLQDGEADYAFLYRSVVNQNDLKFLALPPGMDLSMEDYTDQYKKAKVEITGPTPAAFRVVSGEPIFYAVTIPENAARKEAAINYLKVMLGPVGQQVFEKNSQKQLVPCVASDKTKVPKELAGLCK